MDFNMDQFWLLPKFIIIIIIKPVVTLTLWTQIKVYQDL